MLTIHQLFSTH